MKFIACSGGPASDLQRKSNPHFFSETLRIDVTVMVIEYLKGPCLCFFFGADVVYDIGEFTSYTSF